MLGVPRAGASTAYGDLNNFDAVNDTGQECHGFEIEIDGVRSTDITYTYDWNHYGAPQITRGPHRSRRIPRCSSATRARRIPTAPGRRSPTGADAPLGADRRPLLHRSRHLQLRLRALRRGLLRHADRDQVQLAARRRRRQPGAGSGGERRHAHLCLHPAGAGGPGAAARSGQHREPARSWPRSRRRWCRSRPARSSACRPGSR